MYTKTFIIKDMLKKSTLQEQKSINNNKYVSLLLKLAFHKSDFQFDFVFYVLSRVWIAN